MAASTALVLRIESPEVSASLQGYKVSGGCRTSRGAAVTCLWSSRYNGPGRGYNGPGRGYNGPGRGYHGPGRHLLVHRGSATQQRVARLHSPLPSVVSVL